MDQDSARSEGSPTNERLATALHDTGAPTSWRRVAAIQPDGRRAPFFCVAPPFFCIASDPLFRPLAHRLGFDQPFLGLSLDTETLPTPFTLEDVAADHVETIRKVQPHGPYFLGGWSAGGATAYEIAQQLKMQGEDVAMVVLFDTVTPAQIESISGRRAMTWAGLGALGRKLGFHWSNVRRLTLTEALGYTRERLATIMKNLKGRAWRVHYKLHLWGGRPIEGWLRNVDQVGLFTFLTYRPRPYSGRVILFRCTERPPGSPRDPAVGWRKLVGHGLEIHESPGNHVTMFSEPNVDTLASTLGACLRTAQRVGAGEGRSAEGRD